MVFEAPIFFQLEETYSHDCFETEDPRVSVFRLISLLEPDILLKTLLTDFPDLTSSEQLKDVKEIVY